MRTTRTPRGVVALVTVLVVMVTLLSLGLAIAAVGRGEIALTAAVEDGEAAFAVADACVEEGLARLKDSAAYAGGTFSLDGGTCALSVTDLGGSVRRVRGQGSYRDAIRIVVAEVTLLSNAQGDAKKVRIDSWKEAD